MMKFYWWQSLPWLPWRVVCFVNAADEVPDSLPRKGAVIVGTEKHPKWLAFDCPCRRRHRIMLNLDVHRKPRWKVLGKSRLTVHPSVDSLVEDVRCHYFLRNGRVEWT